MHSSTSIDIRLRKSIAGRLHQVLAERDGRKLERETTGQKHAALDRPGQGPEVQVAVDELRPRVANADHRPRGQGILRDALSVDRGAMDEPGQVAATEPAAAAQAAVVLGHRFSSRLGSRVSDGSAYCGGELASDGRGRDRAPGG